MTSIFDPSNSLSGSWVSWNEVGKMIEGTYVRMRPNWYDKDYDKTYNLYEIRSPEHGLMIVKGKPGIDGQMQNVKPGQIVGMKYVRDIAPKRPGNNPTKDIHVFANPNIVDPNFNAAAYAEESPVEHEEPEETVPVADTEEPQPALPDFSEPVASPVTEPTAPVTATPTLSTADMVREVSEIAKSKLGATTPEEVKTKVMEATNMAFVEANLPNILEALRSK